MKIILIDGIDYIEKKIVQVVTRDYTKIKFPDNTIVKIFFIVYIFYLRFILKYKYLITFNDNSKDIQKISRFLNFKKAFYIQNGYRSARELNTKYKNNLDIFFCFGNSVEQQFKFYGHHANKFIPVGSILFDEFKQFKSKKSLFQLNFNKSYFKKQPDNFDICLVSQWKKRFFEEKSGAHLKEKKSMEKIDLFLDRIQRDLNLKVIIATKTSLDEEIEEYNYYQNLNKNFYITKKTKFSSFLAVEKSKIILSFYSTLAFESVCMKKKFLFCNFSSDKVYANLKDGPWILKEENYQAFKKKISYLKKISGHRYYKKNKTYFNKLMLIGNKCTSAELITNEILKNNTCNNKDLNEKIY